MLRTRNVRRIWNTFSQFFLGFGPWKNPSAKQVPKALTRRHIGLEQLETRLVPATYLYNSTTKLLTVELASGESAGLQSSNTYADQVSVTIFGGTLSAAGGSDPLTGNWQAYGSGIGYYNTSLGPNVGSGYPVEQIILDNDAAGAGTLTLSQTGGGYIRLLDAPGLDLQVTGNVVNDRSTFYGSNRLKSINVGGTAEILRSLTTSGSQTFTGNATIGVGDLYPESLVTLVSSGSSISFGGTVDSQVSQNYPLTVNASAAITLGGAIGSVTALGAVTLVGGADLNLPQMTLPSGQGLSVTLSAGNITQSGALAVSGVTTLNVVSGNITLDNASNNFGTVNITSGNVTTLVDSTGMVLGTGTTTSLNVTAAGDITQSGALTVSGTTMLAVGSNNITLSNASNNFGTVNITSGNVTTLVDSTGLDLGTGTTTSLNVTAVGDITQSGALTVSGTTMLAVGTNNITLSNVGNNFGTVNITTANVLTLVDSTAVDLGNITTTGNVSVTAVGITQGSGATLDAGSGAITLNGGGGNITAAGTITTTSSASNTVQVQSGNVVSLGVVNVASGTVALSNTTTSASFTGNLTTTGLTIPSGAYAVALTGASSKITTSKVTFSNTGTLTLGDSETDTVVFSGGMQAATQSSSSLAGTIEFYGADNTTVVFGSVGLSNANITLTANTVLQQTAGSNGINLQNWNRINGAYALTTSFKRNVDFLKDIGSITPLASANLSVTNGGQTLSVAGIRSNGPQALSGATVTMGANGDGIYQTNTAGANGSFTVTGAATVGGSNTTVTTGSGNISFGGNITYSSTSRNLITNTTGTTTLSSTIGSTLSRNGNLSITTGGSLLLPNMVFGSGRVLTVAAGGDITQSSNIVYQSSNGTTILSAGSSNITLLSPFNDFGTVSILSGNVAQVRDTSALGLGTTTANSLSLTTGGNIAQSGALSISGTTTVNAGVAFITLNNAGNDFGTVNITSGNVVSITDKNALVLGTSSITTLNIVAGGDLTQSGALSVVGATQLNLPSTASIDLSTQANAFTGNVSLGNSTLPSYQIRDTGAFAVGNVTATTLTINTTGDITHASGKVLNISGTTTLNAGTGSITLSNASNDFNTVNITGANVTTLVDANALVLGTSTATTLNVTANGAITQTGGLTVSGTTTIATGSSNNITLSNASNDFGTVNITSGKVATLTDSSGIIFGTGTTTTLNVTAGGAITQTGALTVSGATTIAAGSANNITLSNASNNFGTINITSANVATLQDTNDLVLGTSALTTLNVTAAGNITQSGAITTTGDATFTVGSGKGIDLSTSTNSFGGVLTFGASSGSLSFLGLNTNTAITLSALNLSGYLTAITSGGDITQTGAIVVGGTTTLGAGSNNITLSNASNDFGTVNITSGNVVTLNDSGDLILGTSAPTTLNVTAAGNITQSGAITTTGNANFTVDNGKGIDLSTSANTFGGVLTFGASSGSLSFMGLDTNTAIALPAMNLSGYLTAITSAGDISQAGAIVVGGATTLSAGSNNITLDNAGNDFGTVNITSGNVTTLRDSGALVLGTGTTTTLDVTTGGALTQTGALTVSGTTTIAAGSANYITLSNAGNDFGTVAISSGKVVTLVDSTAIDLGNITAAGNVSVTGVGITQGAGATLDAGSGAITLNGGAGNITAQGTITTTSNSATALQIQSGNVVSLGVVNVANSNVVLSSITGPVTFTGNLTAGGLTVPAGAYDVALTGTTTNITASAVNFQNTGNLTLGDGGDSLSFGGGLTHTAGQTNLAGTVGTGTSNLSLGAVVLTNNSTLSGNTPTITSVAGGGFDLALDFTGITAITGGAYTGIRNLSTGSGGTTQLSGTITTTGTQTYSDAVTLTGATTTAAGSAAVVFGGTVDGAYALTLGTTGNASLGGLVGGGTALASLTNNGVNRLNINGGGITTTANQTYSVPVYLGVDTTLTTNGGAGTVLVTSTGSIDGQTNNLTINGNLELQGAITNVTVLDVNGAWVVGADITTSGALAFDTAVLLSADVNIKAASVVFGNTVNSQSSTARDLNLTATSGNVTFDGAVGGVNRLDSLTITTGNVVALNGTYLGNSFTSNSMSFSSAGKTINTSRAGYSGGAVSITTTGSLVTGAIGTSGGVQTEQYTDGYKAGAVTLTGGTLSVDAITAAGSNAFDSDNGGTGGQVSINGTTVNLTGNISTQGGIGFNDMADGGEITVAGTLNLPAARLISTGAGAGNILLSGVTGNNYGLQLISGAGSTTVSGAVTGVGALTLQENALTSTGAVSFTGNVSATSLVTYASSYDVSFTGQSTAITSATTFRNTGALTLGDSGSSVDTLTFTGGLVATAPSSITTGGSISTVNTTLTLGAFTASADTALGAGTGTVTVGPAIIGSGATLTLGLGGASTILAGTITGSSATTSNLAFNTTGSATVSGAADTLNNITVTNSGGLTFQNTVTAGNVSIVDTTAGATVALQGNLNLTGDLTGAGSSAYTLALAGALNNIGGAGSFTATGGTLAINDQATDSTVFTGGLVNTAGTTNLIGGVSTVGTSSLNLSAVTLVGGAQVATANGPLTLGTIAGGSNSLGLTSNGSAGVIRVTGAAGNLGIVTVSAGSGVNATFESSLSANSLVTAAANFNMRLLGNATIGGATVFNNTGITTLNGGTLTFQGGVTATAGPLNLGGTIATLNAGATFGDSTLLGATTINTGTGTGSINFQGLLDGAQTLSLVAGAGPVNFGGIVGGVSRLGAVTIVSAKDVSLAGAFSAASLTQSAGTGVTSISGPLDTSALAGVNLNTYGISVDAPVSTAASSLGIVRLNAGAGGMTLTALGDINSDGAVSLYAAGPGITSAGDITTNDANVLVQNKFMMDGNVSISTGGAGAGDITFGNTINGESDLALNAGTGDIRLRYVGTLAVPNSISIASAKDVIGYYLMKVGSFTQTAGSGTTSIRGLTTDTNLGVNIKASAISILNRPVTTLESGPVTLNATSGLLSLSTGGDITSTGAVTLTGASGISAQGTVTTTADDITFVSATTLTDALTVRSTGIAGVGNISFQGGITGATKALVVSSQEGSIAFNGNSSGIGALTLQENSVLASGPVTFNGNLSATSINTYAQDYAVSFLGATTAVTNALTLKNTGLVTLGDQPSDSLIFTGGLVHTAGNTTLNGAVATTNAAVTLNTVSLGGNSSINAGTGNISFANSVDGSADLTLTGGVIQFTEEVGGTTPLGQLTIASATDLTFDKSVAAAGLQQILGSGTTTLKGEVTTTSGAGVNLAANLVSVQAAVDAGNNPVVLSADNLNITAAVSSGTANTTLTGYSAATVVDLGGKDAAGIVGISQAEQALITAGTLVVGTASNTGGVTVSQSVTTGTFGNLSLRSGGVIAVNAAITTTATSGLVTANATGNLNIAAAGVITSGGAVSLTGSAINTAGNISTTNDAVSFNSPTTLTGDVAVNTGTGAGDILFASTLAGGAKNLTLVSGSGATTLQGSASGLGTLTIQEDAATSTGAFAAQGNLAAATVNTFGRNYDVAFTGDTTAITNPLNLLNTGKATLGNGALDTFTLAGLTHTTGNTALHGVFTLTGNLTLNSTALDGDTTIGLGVNDAVFNQTVDGPGALDITGRDVLFSGIVGGTRPLVNLTATDAKTTLTGNVTTVGAQSYNGNVVLGGGVRLATTNSNVSVTGTVDGTVSGQQALTVAAGTGTVSLGGAVGGGVALEALNSTAGTTSLFGDVTTVGTQDYNGGLKLTGDVKLATTNSAVNIGGQVNGTNAGLESLTITTGTANVTLADTVGSTKALEQLAITANLTSLAGNVTTAGTQNFNGAVVLTGNATLTTTNSDVTVNGPVDANNPTLQGMFIKVGTANVTLGDVGGVRPLNGLDVTAGKAVLGSVSTGAGGQTYTANTTLNGNYLAQGGGAINFNGPATLAGNSEVDGTSGAVTFGSTLNGAGNSLKLNSSASVTLTGEASGLDTLGLQPVAGPAGSVSILGNLTANTLAVSTNSFAVSMTGSKVTIATPVDFRNIGLVTLGDASSDSFTFNGGLTHTAGATYLAGSIVTSGDKVELGTTTLANNGSITTAGGDIVLGGTVDGLSAGAQGLTLTAAGGNISIAGKVGDTNALGAMVIASANNTTFSSTVKAAGVTQTAGTGTTTFTGNLTTSGTAGVNINAAGIAVNGQVATTGNGIVRLNAGATGLTMTGGYIDADGAVSLFSSAASGITFTGTVRTTSDNVLFQNRLTVPGNLTVNTTVAGSGANITFGNAMTFTASATLDLTAGTGAIQLRRMDTSAGTSAVVINSVGNLSATQAMSVGSFRQVAGGGNTTFAGTGSLTATAAAGVNITTAGAFSTVQPITATAGGVSVVAGTTVTLSTASVVSAAGAVTLTGPTGVSLGANLTATNSNLTVTGAATLTGDVTVTAGTGNVSFGSTINGAKALSVNASGLTSFLGSVGNTTRLTSLATNAGGTTSLGGAVVQTNGPIGIHDAVLLAGSTVLSSNGGAIALDGTIDGTKAGYQTLGLTAGSGNITVGGAVGGTTALGAIAVNSANVTSFASAVKAASLTQVAGGSTSLLGAVSTTGAAGVNLTANAVSVASNITTTGGGLVALNAAAGLLNLTAMGGITADGAVSLTGSAGIDVGGAITTTNDAVSFNGATRLTSPLTVDTGAGAGDITFSAGVNSSVAGAQGLTLTAGTGDISTGVVGGTTALGAMTINSARNVTALEVKATSLTQVAGSGTALYTGNIATTGGAGVNLSGSLVSVGSITSANNPIALNSDRISMNGSVDAGNSSVTLGASSNGTIIDLGGPDVTGTTLGLTNAELSKVTAANLIIGSAANTGGIRVTDSISIASKAMSLTTGSNITFATNGALTGNLASTEITLNTGLSGGVVGASDTAVDVVANALTVNGGSAGIGANATPLRTRVNTLVTDTNDATDGDQYLAQDPTVNLTVGQGDLDAGSATITLKGGKFYTITGGDILSALTIGSGASAGGTGTIQAVTVLGGGNLMPGAMTNPRVGILNTGAVTLTSNGNLNIFAGPANTATGPQPSGVIASSGAVDLGDANLYLTFAQANMRPGQTFEIITGASVTGTLKVGGLTVFDGDTFEAGSYLFRINYTPTSVVLTALGTV